MISNSNTSPAPMERFLVFECAGESCLGVLSMPPSTSQNVSAEVAVVIIVGGPQYRVGSHRQFVLLARRLAAAGIPVFRFDIRGMGDSSGAMRSFQDAVPDIEAALTALQSACPAVSRVVLWGLCDAASAALMYWQRTHDRRVAGMALLNPWVRSEVTLAKTHLKHYYGARILNSSFWTKLVKGDVDFASAFAGIARGLAATISGRKLGESSMSDAFQSRMAEGLAAFTGPVLLILSGRDFTAHEFDEHVRSSTQWDGLLERGNVEQHRMLDADHTFSTALRRGEVEDCTLDWLNRFLARQ